MARLATKSGKSFLVDDEDVPLVSKFQWCDHGTGYLVSRVRGQGRNQYLHRLIAGAEKGQYVDHINGDRSDNRRSNLRICSNAENMRNSGRRKNNQSGFKGVWLNKANGFWYAALKKDYVSYHAGHFRNPEDAARAYDKLAAHLHGEFAHLNFKE